MGVILYTGTDPAASQASTIFGGSHHVKSLIDRKMIDARKWIDWITTAVKYVQICTPSSLLLTMYVIIEAWI